MDLEERWRKGEGYKKCVLFYRAIQKYGWDNFEHTILEKNIDSQEKANEKETYYIKLYHTYVEDPECNGYNLILYDNKKIVSNIARQHMSEAQKKYYAEHPRTKEMNQELSKKLKHFYSTEYGKQRASEMRKKAWQNEEYRIFHSEIAKGKNNPAAKKVQCLEEPSIIFDTVSEASKWCNNGSTSLRSHIAAQIQGKRKTCGKHPESKIPLHWRYVNE